MEPRELIPLASGRPDLVANWRKICLEQQHDLDVWRAKLKADGVRAAHPDDGWVDDRQNIVFLSNPHFDLGLRPGDVMAIGDPHGYRFVRILERAPLLLLPNANRWRFDQCGAVITVRQTV